MYDRISKNKKRGTHTLTEELNVQEPNESLPKEDKPAKKSFVSFLNIQLDTEENILKSLISIKKELYFFALFVLVFHSFLYFIKQGDAFFFVDVCILSIVGYFLPTSKSRTLAVFLGFYALMTVLVTVQNMLGMGQGGKNILLSIILTMMSINAIKATFAYHKITETKIKKKNVLIFWVTMLTLIIGCFFTVSIGYGVLIALFKIPEVKEEILGSFIICPLIVAIPLLSILLNKKFPMTVASEITE